MAIIIPFPKPSENPRQEPGLGIVGNTVIRVPGPEALPAPARMPEPEIPVKRKRGSSKEAEQRLAMLAKVHIALPVLYKNLEGFTEDTYRFTLQERWGVTSAGAMKNWQLHELLQYLTRLGWLPKKGKHRKHAPETLTLDLDGMGREEKMKKIEAFLAEKGRKENTDIPWGYAVAILKRQTAHELTGQVTRFEDADHKQLDGVIAALWRDARRKGRRTR